MAVIGPMRKLTIGNKTYQIAAGLDSLPIASASTLGGIKVGTGLTIDSTTGVLSATGTDVTIDNAVSGTSTNPVQNKVIKEYVDGLVAGVLHYKGTKATTAALPSSGNITGDVWHVTQDGGEYAWDGSTWQELGTVTDLSGYMASADYPDLTAIEGISATSGLLKKTAANTWTLDTSNYLTSFTETDPVYSASAAAGITSTDIANWNGKVSDDKTWNGVSLNKSIVSESSTATVNIPLVTSTSSTTAYLMPATYNATNGSAGYLARYNNNGYLTSLTPTTGDSSTKVATTAFVQGELPTKVSDLTNDSGFTTNAGTVTSVGLTNATNGGLSISGSPITSSGSITVGHSNVLSAAQTTQAVYPIKIDKNGHISEYGNAISIPTKVSDLTNDSGFITSDSDEKLAVYQISNTNVHYPILGRDSEVTATRQYDPNFKYQSATDATLTLGANGGKNGILQMFKGQYYIGFKPDTLTAVRTITLPDKTGTVALTSDIPDTSNFLTAETDPIFTASAAAGITSSDITSWNNKADEYTAGDGIDITSNVISVDSNLTVQGDTAYLQYTEPIDVTKQDVLVSGQNIKTINNQSILGSGNINTVTNLVDGSSTGSIRGIGTVVQGTGYALGNYALAAGQGTVSQGRSQTTIGEYNTIDSSSNSSTRGQYAFVVGNGIDTNTRSNAFTVDWQGNTQVKKTLTVGSNSNITGGLQVGALENDYGLNDQALLEEETKQKWNTILGNGALANLLAGDVGGRIATSGGGSTISNMEWNLVDTVIGNSDSITIPEDVFTYNEQVEVLAQIVLTQGTTDVTICGSFLIPNNNDIWMMNGYVTSSTDWGLVDFNLSDHGRTIELNNCYYAATQHNTDATVNIYYRLEESLLTDDVIDIWTEILGGDPSLNPSAGNIAATGSAWLQVQDPQNLPTNVTLGNNNLMYKTSSDKNTVILTGTLSVNLAAASITDTTIDIPLGFNVSRVPSTAVELPLGVDGNQSQATASIKVGTTGAVSLIIQVIDNSSIAAELSLGFSGSFFPLV